MKMTKKDKYRIKILEKRIADGDLDAMIEYAQLYKGKFCEEVTPEIAQKIVTCYETCIEAGDLTAALSLGAMYYCGEFIPRDYLKAIKYYKMATEADDDETQEWAWTSLGYCYYYAFNCYMRAAVQRNANALYKIGDMYRYGRYVKKDEQMALTCYWQALSETYDNDLVRADISKRIGEFALYGIAMEKDIYLALRMLTESELKTYTKIKERDPFAASLLPKIQQMLGEVKAQVERDLGLSNEKI